MRPVPHVLRLAMVAALGAVASARGGESALVDLQPAAADAKPRPISYRGFQSDEQGMAEIKPFANAAGRLMFKVEGDTVRADTNGDGRIDDADAPAVKPRQTTIKVAALCGAKTNEYPIEVLLAQKQMLVVGSRARLEGRWGERRVEIGDTDLNGAFGSAGDSLAIAESAGAKGNVAVASRPWSRTVGLDGRLYAIAMEGADKLRIEPYGGAVAELRITADPAPTKADLQLTEASQAFCTTIHSVADPIRAVPGTYHLRGSFAWNDGGQRMFLSSLAKPVVLGAEPQTLKIGPPLTVDFEAVRDGATVAVSKVRIAGVAGETWQPAGSDDADAPAAYIRAGATEKRLATMEYG